MLSDDIRSNLNDKELIRIERRNFIFVSCVLIFLKLTNACITTTSVEGIGINIPDSWQITGSDKILITLAILWLYFLWRYCQFFKRLKSYENFSKEFYNIVRSNKNFQLAGEEYQDLIKITSATNVNPRICYYLVRSKRLIIIYNPFFSIKSQFPDPNNVYCYYAHNLLNYYWIIIKLWGKVLFYGAYISEYYMPFVFAVITPAIYIL